jgi:hypothetical protein
MRLYALFRTNYRAGWQPILTWRTPTLTLTYTRAGYTGDAAFELDTDLPLGAELQLLDDAHATRYLATLTDKTYNSTSRAYQYRARGACEHFLDLPFPYTDLNRQAERTGAAQSIWEYHLANHLAKHTPRYQPIYDLSLASLRTRDIQLRTARDAYKLYQSLKPCRITPEILPTGRIRMILEDLPLTPYPLPKDALWEISESIRETYTRLSISNPASQLIPDRRIANPEHWQLVVPAGATASITPLDPNHYGYLGAYATRIDCEITLMVWVGVQLRQPIRAPKSNTGAYAPLTVGYYARGDNARVRIRVNTATSPDEVFNNLNIGYTETAYTLTPTTDELTLTIELQPASPTLPATLVIDGVYAIPGNQPLSERNYPPHKPVAAQIPSHLTAGTIATIDAALPQGGNVYDLVVRWAPFQTAPPAGAPVQILQPTRYLTGSVVSRPNPTVLRVQLADPIAPNPGDTLYLMHGAAADSEARLDTRYGDIDTPIHLSPTDLAHLITTYASPAATLTAQLPPTEPIPEIGQIVPHPRTNEPLVIHEIQLAVNGGELAGVQLKAGAPEPTLRALLRKIPLLKPREP